MAWKRPESDKKHTILKKVAFSSVATLSVVVLFLTLIELRQDFPDTLLILTIAVFALALWLLLRFMAPPKPSIIEVSIGVILAVLVSYGFLLVTVVGFVAGVMSAT